jgi:E3 ubiquitin-protein ligase makorin
MESYRARLGAIPCRHFAQGRGSCPFGSSCFFSHLLEDGSEAPAPARRYAATADGEEVRVVEPLRLSAFLG